MGLSPYTSYLDADINYTSRVKPFCRILIANFESLPAPESGLSYNSIGRADTNDSKTVHPNQYLDRSATVSVYSPLWANKGTEWVAFFTESAEEGVIAGWQVVPRDGLISEKDNHDRYLLMFVKCSEHQMVFLVVDIDNRVLHVISLDLD